MKKGFTLIELLVVVAVVAIVLACILPAVLHRGHRFRVTQGNQHWTATSMPSYSNFDHMYHFHDAESDADVVLSPPVAMQELAKGE